ncbi:S-layer homology domain-containing protein [Lysinibacillus sphaericus]|uniref:S-layer homology domain-containing protein n=1 Tax=Lysinibacillus sphaericus TaxID=1421 RepID=UPI0021610CE2|nr:S-layer homology domain-containing protein [Lysinibacillus sphaericus]MCS1381618.1 S-layer homology domain-containing protein [Lysinibacillus sphaericus]
MDIFKKQIHLVIIFILIFSLLSPAATGKAQHLEGETYEQNTSDINNTELDNPNEQLTMTPLIENAPNTISDIQLNTTEPLFLTIGETSQLAVASSTTEDSTLIEWSSSAPTITTVDNQGLVTAISIGDAQIYVKVGEVSKAVNIYVITPEEQNFINLVNNLPEIIVADEVAELQLTAARKTYSALTLDQKKKALISNYNNKLGEKEGQLVEAFINSIPSFDTLDETIAQQLINARTKWNTLLLNEKKKLVQIEAILIEKELKYVGLLISTISSLEISNEKLGSLFNTTRKIYKGIPAQQKVNVINYQNLVDKEIEYVLYLIDSLPETIQIADEATKKQLEEARTTYNALDKNQKTKINNYQELVDKENIFTTAPRIQEVIFKINVLPPIDSITWADHLKVNATQQAYDNLSAQEKQSVSNYNKLEALQKRLVELKPTTIKAYNSVGQYLVSSSPQPVYQSEWTILTLARGGYVNLSNSYYSKYYKNIENHVKSNSGVIASQATDYSRVIIALTAIGKDPTNVAGYNLVEKLTDFNFVTRQGINSAVFTLIALDTWDFELPKTATTTREKLIKYILQRQLNDGGFAYAGTEADPDITAMVIQSLAPYYQSNAEVKTAVNRAIDTLAAIQLPNGGYKSDNFENAESAAQVVTALASLGINANNDNRFNKVISNIMTYSSEDGGFKHVLIENKANGMATVQVGYTLAAYNRLLNNQTALYDMSDTKSDNTGNNPGDIDNGSDGEEPSNPDDKGNQPSNPDGQPSDNEEIGYTTFSIRISSSEVPLKSTSTKLFAGETAFDVLKRVTSENSVALSYRQTEYGTYIDGIAGVYEFDRGPLSGWMYRVNGQYPSYSAALYTLSPGDSVEWLYTTDLGKDVGGYVEDGSEKSGPPAEENKEKCKGKNTENCKETENNCTGVEAQCAEEMNKGNKGNEENKGNRGNVDNPVAEITIEDGSNKAIITSKHIKEYLEKNVQKFVIQSKNNFKIEIPTSIFTRIKLTESEQIIASVTKEAKNKQFTVKFGIEATNGKTKSITIDKEYLKVTLLANELKPNMVVLQLDGSEYKPVPHRIVNGEIVLFTKSSGTFVVTESTVTFNDIAHLANKEEIEFLASRLVIKGTTPETFEPYKPITRAQFSVLISRALGLQAKGENPFNDTEGKWYATDIQALFEAGITKGTTSSTFNPEAPITRQQAAAFMARILEYLNADVKATGEVNFTDASNISAEYLPYIELLNSLDIMTGKPDGSFDPRASLTRGQTAKILKRTLNIAGIM